MTPRLFFILIVLLSAFGSIFVKYKFRYIVTLFLLFLPIPAAYIFYFYNGIYLIDIPIYLFFFYKLIGGKKIKFSFPGITMPVALFLSWGAITGLLAWHSGAAISDLTKDIRGYLAFLLIVNFVDSKGKLLYVFYIFMLVFSIQCFFGIYHWHFKYIFGWLPLYLLGVKPSSGWRAFGTFQHPGFYADFLILFLPVSFRFFAYQGYINKKNNLIFLVIFMAGILSLFISYARGPWIAFVVSMSLMFFYSNLRKKLKPKKLAPFVFITFFLIVFVIRYSDKVIIQFSENSGRQSAADIRIPLDRVALRLIADRPIFGTGLANYSFESPAYVVPEKGIPLDQLSQRVHNVYLLLASETGIPGLVFFLWFVVVIIFVTFKAIKSPDSTIRNIAFGILTGYIAVLIAFLSSPDYDDYNVKMIFWAISGFMYSTYLMHVKISKFIKLKAKVNKSTGLVREYERNQERHFI